MIRVWNTGKVMTWCSCQPLPMVLPGETKSEGSMDLYVFHVWKCTMVRNINKEGKKQLYW